MPDDDTEMRDDIPEMPDEDVRIESDDDVAAWEHPLPGEEPEDEPAIDATVVPPDPDESDIEPASLPEALFEDDAEGDRILHWHVHRDTGVVLLANTRLEAEGYRLVATTQLIASEGGDRWEIPAALVIGSDAETTVPLDARFNPGESIHFRASRAMIEGKTRSCYVLTDEECDRYLD